MTYITGVVSFEGVHMSGDQRATVGGSATGDNLRKVHKAEYENSTFVFGTSGRGSLSGRVKAAVENDVQAVERGDADEPSNPKELLNRVVSRLLESHSDYEGNILLGGYGSEEQGQLCHAGSPEFNIRCIEEKNNPVDLLPPGLTSKEDFHDAKQEIWASANGDVEEYLRNISSWVAEHDKSNSCSEEVNIVSI